jgi:hypothetical protein
MAASMTIRITEDEAPDGCVQVDYDIDGADNETIRENGVPPAWLVGAEMMKLAHSLPSPGGPDGSEVPRKSATIDRMT